jgi:predicted ATP-dependent endonuclease of OLD family
MKIIKFQVKNYKSIIDSGICWIEKDLTIFAGKNESGKTTLLEALENFNYGRPFRDETKPLNNNQSKTSIAITFLINPEELNSYYSEIGINSSVKTATEVTITKNSSNEYHLDEAGRMVFLIQFDGEMLGQIDFLKDQYHKIRVLHSSDSNIDVDFFELDLSNTKLLKTNINDYMDEIDSLNSLSVDLKDSIISELDDMKNTLNVLEDIDEIVSTRWKAIYKILPNFILFRSFEDLIPNNIAFKELESNEFIKDIQLISNLDIKLILSNEDRKKHQHKDVINIDFNNGYSKYWKQDDSKIKIEWDSTKLFIWIIEDYQYYEPSQRSKGKQWHLSFYIRVSARTNEKKSNIILIDEPGMFLHASAQKDIYEKLKHSSEKIQILFTTHSPYLINSSELFRLRLVEKDKNEGTYVTNKIHKKADKESLTPILTAIGLELNHGIQNIHQAKNIIVEGPSDVMYLQALSRLLGNTTKNFVFGGGAGNMGNIGSIISGWGGEVIYLFDNDQGKKDGAKNLEKVWHVSKSDIISITDEAGSVEDIFSKDDFINFVLLDKVGLYDESNSLYLKNNRLEKVLLSKEFLSSVIAQKNISLSDETKQNFNRLIQRIEKIFDVKTTEKSGGLTVAKK